MPAGAAPDTIGTLPEGTRLEPLAFSAIAGWAKDDHAVAFEAFLISCRAILADAPALRQARSVPESLARICRVAIEDGARRQPRAFFETHFRPHEVIPPDGRGFLTAYFEPEVEAALERSAEFPVPVLARPDDLVTLQPGDTRPSGLDPALAAARRTAQGLEAYPDRAAIWGGALGDGARPIAWLRDEAELFIIQVQGSARLRLREGGRARLTYSGRNGLPYTSIGRILVANGEIPLAEMSLARLMAWLRVDRQRGRALMERNRSYVFFALESLVDPAIGPTGGAGVPLTKERSLAVDRSIWPYGLPVWIEASPLSPGGGRVALDRLMVAQDTGSAIVGPARADFFMGSGAAAGDRAGLVRDPLRFVVLLPAGE